MNSLQMNSFGRFLARHLNRPPSAIYVLVALQQTAIRFDLIRLTC
jgi:hypothetical protein